MSNGPFMPPITEAFMAMAAQYKAAVRWGFERGLLTLRRDAEMEAHQFVRQHYGVAVQTNKKGLNLIE